MRVLLLGKNGQVGWELQRSLAPLGEIIALGRKEADLEDAAALRTAVTEATPDIIVNAAAYTAVDRAESEQDRAERVNCLAVGELGELAASCGAWVIHYSTDYVFDGTKTSPYVETDHTNPLNVYGRSKRDGETALAQSGARHLIFRTSWVHSGRGSNFIRTILARAAEGETLRVVADQKGAPTSVEFIARVTARAVARIGRSQGIVPGIYNLTSSGQTTRYGLAQFVLGEALRLGARLRATPEEIIPITSAEYLTPVARPINSMMSNEKLRRALNMEAPDWRLDAARSVAQHLLQWAPDYPQ